MHNLMVGNVVANIDDSNEEPFSLYEINNPTGMQSSYAKGGGATENLEFIFPWIGTTEFSNEDKHGTNYSDYSGSLIETYVNDYKVAIEAMGVNVELARLITKDELVNTFGCNESENTCAGSVYPWIYATTYWSGSAMDDGLVWYVGSDGFFAGFDYDNDNGVGVRPVILILKDDIKRKRINFTFDDITYQAYEGMTWIEWVRSEFNTGNYYMKDETGSSCGALRIYDNNYDNNSELEYTDIIENNGNYSSNYRPC
jgi:hypothetical protein